MKRFLVLLVIISHITISGGAQSLKCGTYVGDGTTDFLIVTEDSVCYRLQTSFGLVYNTIGIGTYKYEKGILSVITTDRIFQVTTDLSTSQRSDSLISLRVIDYNRNPLPHVCISFNRNKPQTSLKRFICQIIKGFTKRTSIENGVLTTFTDENGFIDDSILLSLAGEQIQVTCQDVWLAEMRVTIDLKKGFDFVLKSEIPTEIPCSVGRIGCHEFLINVLENDCLEHIIRNPGYPNQADTTRLFLLSKECSFNLNRFKNKETPLYYNDDKY